MRKASFIAVVFSLGFVGLPAAAEVAQVDTLVSVALDNGLEQRGVLSMAAGDAPWALVLLFPGDPSVLKAEVVDGRLVRSRVGGSPLVRARNLLVRPGIATVLVDCRSDQPEQCGEDYVMSAARFEDVRRLVTNLRQAMPSVKKVWVVGHSSGTLSSASLARQGAGVFDGAIHASTILSPKAQFRSLASFDFAQARIPQLFVHQRDDACPGTPYALVASASARYGIPLATLTEATGTRGPPCGPHSQHGFAGAEPALMKTIDDAIERGTDATRRTN